MAFSEVEALLRPGGKLIGHPGSSRRIRVMEGGIRGARELFGELASLGEGSQVANYPGTLVAIAGVGRVGLRPVSVSGPPTIDVRVPGIGIDEIKFPVTEG